MPTVREVQNYYKGLLGPNISNKVDEAIRDFNKAKMLEALKTELTLTKLKMVNIETVIRDIKRIKE